MKRKLDLRYPGFRYQGEATIDADDLITIDSPALADALTNKLIPVGPSSKADASNIEISSFSIDDSGRITLTSPDLYALLENTSFTNTPAVGRSIEVGGTVGGVSNTSCSPSNNFCSSIHNGTCPDITNGGCS